MSVETVVRVFKKLPLTTTAIGLFTVYTTIRMGINRFRVTKITHVLDENDLIDKLPTEVLALIFDCLGDPRLILPVSATSKKWHTICNQWVWPKKYEVITKNLHKKAPDYMARSKPLSEDLSKKFQVFMRLQQWREITGAKARPKQSRSGIGHHFYSRPETLFKVLYNLLRQPHPHYLNNNRSQAQAMTKFFSILLSILPFMDQLLFWAPQIAPKLWDYSPWAIATQIRMILSMFSMFAFDSVPSPGTSGWPRLRIALMLIFHLVSIGFKGLLVTTIFSLLAAVFADKVLRKYYDDKLVLFGGLLVIPFIPGLYLAPLHIWLGYGMFTTTMFLERDGRRGLETMRASLAVAVGVFIWTYIAACWSV